MVHRTVNILLAMAFGFAFGACGGQGGKSTGTDSKPLPFDRGGRIISKNFTGTVHLNMLVDADSIYHMNVGNVSFQPGARSNWHSHPGGQILLVTDGKGYYQEKGKPKRIINVGDVVKCPPNVLHWHGATPTDSMVHIAIGPNLDNGSVSWHEAVSDSIYHAAL
jgi:quercetin dioxygenase-like cupin family protein